MAHPKLDKIIDKLKNGTDFSLTRDQYIHLTGADIPQQRAYVEKRSAVAKRAAQYGYKVVVIPETLEFLKIS